MGNADSPADSPSDCPSWAPGYRHLTAEVPGVAFRVRERPEDFRVEEVPDGNPHGEGTHLWMEVEKRGVSTEEAIARLARALGLRAGAFGYAGRKDVHAVARQWLSVEHVEPGAARELELDGVRVLRAERHPRKLRLGQLAGNRFTIVLRGLAAADRPRAEAVLARLVERGLPNYYGAQRFGWSGRAHELGRWLVLGRTVEYLAALCSEEHARPSPARERLARLLAEGSRSERRAAGRLAPGLDPELAAVARQLGWRPGNLDSAVRAVPRSTRVFQLSAWQSRVFNRLLAARLAGTLGIEELVPGDVAAPVRGGRPFLVSAESAPELAPRARAFELAPTGPMAGLRALQPEGAVGELEREALAAEGVGPDDLAGAARGLAGVELPGARRPLRVPVDELAVEWGAEELELRFLLPAGSFATTLLEELRKEHARAVS